MTKTIDIRAICTCSAGELISASTSDSYRAESGIIYQRGSCTVKGINAASIGSAVTFGFKGIKRGGAINRRLLVAGCSVDADAGTTSLTLGCDFTLLKDFREDKVFTSTGISDPSMNAEDAKVITTPLLASKIAEAIAAKLGLSGSFNLTNKFSVAEFDLSGGYVNVLSDLLMSEGLVAYVSTGGSVVVKSALGGGGGAAIGDIIEMAPLAISVPTGAKTTVSYTTRKLKEPETDPNAIKKLNWELQESYGELTTVTVDVPAYATTVVAGTTLQATNRTFQYTFTPYTKTETTYDTLDRVVSRVTTQRTILAAIAPGYVQANGVQLVVQPTGPGAFNVIALPPPAGNIEFTIVTTETTTYKVPAPSVFPVPPDYDPTLPAGYEEVLKVETIVSEPLIKLIGSTNIYRYAGEAGTGFTYGADNSMRFIASKEITTQDTVKGDQGQQVVRTFTERFECRASYTVPGQQGIVEAIDRCAENGELFGENGRAIGLILDARSLEKVGVSTQIITGREVGLQRRPSQAARTLAAWSVEQKTSTETLSGSAAFGVMSFNMPYAPDDTFYKKAGGGYGVQPSDAKAKAIRFGRIQSALRSGLSYGVNVKASATGGGSPGGSAGVSAGGVGVFGLAEGVSYTMDSSGVIMSIDLIPLGTMGAT